MTAKGYGAIAVLNIAFGCLLALAMFLPAALGGFNAFAIAWYLLIFASIATSFYLLAKRRDLQPPELKRVAVFSVSTLVLAIVAPLLATCIAYAVLG